MKYPDNYKFTLYAKVAEIALHENSNTYYKTHNFKKPVFEKPNSYINLLGDIIFVNKSTGLGMTTRDIEARCKCKMTDTINRLYYSGLIEHKNGGYVPTMLGKMYWKAACMNFGQKNRLAAVYVENKAPSEVYQAELPL